MPNFARPAYPPLDDLLTQMKLTDGIDAGELYDRLPTATRLLLSSKTVEKIVDENPQK